MLFKLVLCLWCDIGVWQVSEGWQQHGSNMSDAVEVAELSKKKIQKRKHTYSPNNAIGHYLGSFYVCDVTLGSERWMESDGNMGIAAELAEISKKKNTEKKNILAAQTMLLDIVWAHFMFLMWLWGVGGEQRWWQCGRCCWGGSSDCHRLQIGYTWVRVWVGVLQPSP